jgi:hypothetical protein
MWAATGSFTPGGSTDVCIANDRLPRPYGSKSGPSGRDLRRKTIIGCAGINNAWVKRHQLSRFCRREQHLPVLLKIGNSPDNRLMQVGAVAPIATATACNLNARPAN